MLFLKAPPQRARGTQLIIVNYEPSLAVTAAHGRQRIKKSGTTAAQPNEFGIDALRENDTRQDDGANQADQHQQDAARRYRRVVVSCSGA